MQAQNESLDNLIYYAVLWEHINLIEFLHDRGANLNNEEYINHPLLHLAIKTDNINIIKLLVERGANPNIINIKTNQTSLQLINEHYNNKISSCEEIIKYACTLQVNKKKNEMISLLQEYGAV